MLLTERKRKKKEKKNANHGERGKCEELYVDVEQNVPGQRSNLLKEASGSRWLGCGLDVCVSSIFNHCVKISNMDVQLCIVI